AADRFSTVRAGQQELTRDTTGRRGGRALGGESGRARRKARRRGSVLLRQQLLDLLLHDVLPLGALPVQLAVPAVAHVALLVDQVDAGRVVVAPCLPGLPVVIARDGKFHFFLLSLLLDLLHLLLPLRPRRVNAEDRDVLLGELVLPLPVPGII